VAPLIATLLLLVLGPAALFFGGFSAMATDACGPDDCPPRLFTQLEWIYRILEYGVLFTLPALVTAWALPWTRRWAGVRVCAALASLLPPVAVLLLVFTLPI
jgi:hypothetical protein